LADKPTQLILEALARAAAHPEGLPLHSGKGAPGLFAATSAGKLAAQRCKEVGYLRTVTSEPRAKSPIEISAITEKGLAYLLDQVSPKQVLEDFLRALEGRKNQLDQVLDSVRKMQSSLEGLKTTAEAVLHQIQAPGASGPAPSSNGCDPIPHEIETYLRHWHDSGATGDCALPELYRRVQQSAPQLTIGQFHDGLRRLKEQQRIYLHPWTGPLHELPEPGIALLAGHEIAYYASLRECYTASGTETGRY
jgi:hypothetical protein